MFYLILFLQLWIFLQLCWAVDFWLIKIKICFDQKNQSLFVCLFVFFSAVYENCMIRNCKSRFNKVQLFSCLFDMNWSTNHIKWKIIYVSKIHSNSLLNGVSSNKSKIVKERSYWWLLDSRFEAVFKHVTFRGTSLGSWNIVLI